MAAVWVHRGIEVGEGKNFCLGTTDTFKAISRTPAFKTLGNRETWEELGSPSPDSSGMS